MGASQQDPASPGPARLHTLNNFDAVRLGAAFCVLVSHQFALWGLAEPTVLGIQSIGGIAVMAFFAISGFLVTQSWEMDPHAGRFAARRLLRVWPALAVAVVLAACVLGPLVSTLPLQDYYAHPTFKKYFKHLIFSMRDALPLRFEGNALPTAINGALWTIPIEVRCYATLGVMGVIGLLGSSRRWVLFAMLLAVSAAYMLVAPSSTNGWSNSWHFSVRRWYLLEYGLCFFAGAALQIFRIPQSPRKMAVLFGLCWALGAVSLAADLRLLALWLVVPVTTIAVCVAQTPVLRRAGRFGDLSYGLYIYAFPVQQTLIWLLKGKMSWTGVLALTMGVTCLLAFASWHLVEKRALRFKPRRPAKKLQPEAVGSAAMA